MKLVPLYCILCILCLSLLACSSEKGRLRKDLKAFEATEITIPGDMLMIREGMIHPWKHDSQRPTIIYYVGPKECSDCRISHLMEMEDLFHLVPDTGQYQCMIVLSPKQEEMDVIKSKLLLIPFKEPVYLDIYSEFTEKNLIPEDVRMHCFLIDTTGHPILVGNPVGNEKMYQLYVNMLNKDQKR